MPIMAMASYAQLADNSLISTPMLEDSTSWLNLAYMPSTSTKRD